jgi:hypothetical protein
MPIERKSSEMMPDEPTLERRERADVAADAALILAALGRIEGAVHDERGTVDRLRGLLEEMARAIGRTKAALTLAPDDALHLATLLDELDHRVDTMIELAGGPIAGQEPAAEARDVPTVSSVVSQLGPDFGWDPDPAEPAHAEAPHEAAVSRLKEMVEAMNASTGDVAPWDAPPASEGAAPVQKADLPDEAIPGEQAAFVEQAPLAIEVILTDEPAPVEDEAPAAEEEAASPQEAPPSDDVPPVEEATVEVAPPPEAVLAEAAVAEPAVSAEQEAAAAAIFGDSVIYENELLANFERINALPILPPEEGTAVIFSAQSQAHEMNLDLPALPEAADPGWAEPHAKHPVVEPVAETVPFQEEQASDFQEISVQEEASASQETVQDAVPEFVADLVQDAVQELAAEETAIHEPSGVETPDTTPAPPAEGQMATPELPVVQVPDTEFDPTDFLFGPDPEPDPAAFLLDPAPPIPKHGAISALPQPEFVAAPRAPSAAPAVSPPTPEPDETPAPLAAQPAVLAEPVEADPTAPPQQAPSAAPQDDPLHALKAMSANERLAMFS